MAEGTKFFIGGIPSSVKLEELYEHFGRFGVVKSITAFNSCSKKKLFGFCFVKFQNIFDNEFLNHGEARMFHGRVIEIEPVFRKSKLAQSVQDKHAKRVYLQNIPKYLSEVDLQTIFSQFGYTTNCFIIRRDASNLSEFQQLKPPTSSNYGYVTFSTKEQAEELIRQRYIQYNNTKIYVKKYRSLMARDNPILEEQGLLMQTQLDSPQTAESIYKCGASNKTTCTDLEIQLEAELSWIKPTTKHYRRHEVCHKFPQVTPCYRFNRPPSSSSEYPTHAFWRGG